MDSDASGTRCSVALHRVSSGLQAAGQAANARLDFGSRTPNRHGSGAALRLRGKHLQRWSEHVLPEVQRAARAPVMARRRGISHQGRRLPEMQIPNPRRLGERSKRGARANRCKNVHYAEVHSPESVKFQLAIHEKWRLVSMKTIEPRPNAHAVVPGDREGPPNERAQNRLPHRKRKNVALLREQPGHQSSANKSKGNKHGIRPMEQGE